MSTKPSIKGIDEVVKALNKFGKDAEIVIDAVSNATVGEMQLIAQRLAPYDNGDLRQSIQWHKIDKTYILEAGGKLAPYAPYMEFGTGGLVNVPKEFERQAILSKGKGIRKVNIFPRPFMHPAYLQGQKIFDKDLKAELDVLAKKV